MQWTGQDDAGGSGIANFDIYVSTDRTNYTTWLQGTTNTSAQFTGAPGLTYWFYSVARDYVGNEESPPGTPDAAFTVPHEFAITEISVSDVGQLTLTWSAKVGVRYRVQFKRTLNDPIWLDAGVELKLTGTALMTSPIP